MSILSKNVSWTNDQQRHILAFKIPFNDQILNGIGYDNNSK